MTGRRIYERYLCDLPVEILHEDHTIATRATNVSLGGFFLVNVEGNEVSADSLAYGTNIKVRFSLPELRDGSTTCDAVIRWNSGQGLGVQFGSLRAIEVWALNQFFKNLEPDTPADAS